MSAAEFRRHLRRLGACADGRAWVGRRDLATAWAECGRTDWLLWLAGNAGVDRRLTVHAAADCAETALEYVPEGEERPRLAIAAARAWANDPSEENAQRAREAAYAAAYASAAYAAAADAAAYASAAYAAAADAAAAAYAADAVAAAAAYAAYAAPPEAREQRQRELCALVRARITAEMVASALRGQEAVS